jgi:hypothetical protein
VLNDPPTFEVANACNELSDAAIETLARLLLSLVEQDTSRSEDQED